MHHQTNGIECVCLRGIRTRPLFALSMTLVLPLPALAQTTWYVDKNSTNPVHDGSTWCDAFIELQDALAVAISGDTVLVADGTFTPDQGSGQTAGVRTSTFQQPDKRSNGLNRDAHSN